jgi:DNA-binding NarL/FixJ family response regulator
MGMADRATSFSPAATKIKVAIFDDATLADQHSFVLSRDEGIEVVGNAQKPWDFFTIVGLHSPDVALVELATIRDTQLVLDMIGDLKQKHPGLKCLVYTVKLQLEFFVQAVGHKVDAYVFKDSWGRKQHELTDLIRFVYRGPSFYEPELVELLSKVFDRVISITQGAMASDLKGLTSREHDVIKALIAKPGASDKDLAGALNIGEGAIGQHLQHIFGKLGVHTRQEVIAATILQVLLAEILPIGGSHSLGRN